MPIVVKTPRPVCEHHRHQLCVAANTHHFFHFRAHDIPRYMTIGRIFPHLFCLTVSRRRTFADRGIADERDSFCQFFWPSIFNRLFLDLSGVSLWAAEFIDRWTSYGIPVGRQSYYTKTPRAAGVGKVCQLGISKLMRKYEKRVGARLAIL